MCVPSVPSRQFQLFPEKSPPTRECSHLRSARKRLTRLPRLGSRESPPWSRREPWRQKGEETPSFLGTLLNLPLFWPVDPQHLPQGVITSHPSVRSCCAEQPCSPTDTPCAPTRTPPVGGAC